MSRKGNPDLVFGAGKRGKSTIKGYSDDILGSGHHNPKDFLHKTHFSQRSKARDDEFFPSNAKKQTQRKREEQSKERTFERREESDPHGMTIAFF
jgi:hypothetical protein